MQSGTLAPVPDIKIGEISAEVQFAGLNITPGEFQFNVVLPSNAPDGRSADYGHLSRHNHVERHADHGAGMTAGS